VQVVQRVEEAVWGWRKKKRRFVWRKVVVLGMTAGAWAAPRLVTATLTLAPAAAADDDGIVTPSTQNLPLSSFAHTACLSGINAYRTSYVLRTSGSGFVVNSAVHAE